jgi:hypothetical protein
VTGGGLKEPVSYGVYLAEWIPVALMISWTFAIMIQIIPKTMKLFM